MLVSSAQRPSPSSGCSVPMETGAHRLAAHHGLAAPTQKKPGLPAKSPGGQGTVHVLQGFRFRFSRKSHNYNLAVFGSSHD